MAETFQQELPPYPQYELSSYDPVELTPPQRVVTDAMVEARMQEIMENAPVDYAPTERKVGGPKDNVEIAVEVTLDGEPVKGLCSDSQIYCLGSGSMPIGFDRGVVGIKVGETREFDFEAPDPASDDNAIRMFHAKVTLLHVMRPVKPVLTDEWVSIHIALCKTVEAFRNRTRTNLEKESVKLTEQDYTEQAVAMLATRFDGKIDDIWYESGRQDLLRTYTEQAKAQNMNLEDMVKAQGMDMQQFNMMLMLQVREMLVQGFCLDAWARHYNLEPTDDDVLAVANLMSNGRGKLMLDNMREQEATKELEGMRTAARRYVANKDLVEKAIIKEA